MTPAARLVHFYPLGRGRSPPMQIQSGRIMLYQETDNRTPALTKQFRFEDKKRSVLASLARHDLALGQRFLS